MLGKGGVKCGIKNNTLRQMWKNLLCQLNTFKIGRVMQWRQIQTLLKCCQNGWCDQNALPECLAPMYKTMPYSPKGRRDAEFVKLVHQPFHGLSMLTGRDLKMLSLLPTVP